MFNTDNIEKRSHQAFGCDGCIQFLGYIMINCFLFFLFQVDVHIHMIYKSGGQEGLHDLLNGKTQAE